MILVVLCLLGENGIGGKETGSFKPTLCWLWDGLDIPGPGFCSPWDVWTLDQHPREGPHFLRGPKAAFGFGAPCVSRAVHRAVVEDSEELSSLQEL